MSRFLRCLLAALAALPLVGCSSGTGVKKVTGTVTLDGDPLAGAEVQFWPKDDIQLGSHLSRTGADGRFELFQDPRPGVGIKPGVVLDEISNTDVAPTAARLLGLEMKNVDGHVLEQILK